MPNSDPLTATVHLAVLLKRLGGSTTVKHAEVAKLSHPVRIEIEVMYDRNMKLTLYEAPRIIDVHPETVSME